jgi:hypothetical protein
MVDGEEVFRPALPSRRGEATAWILAALVGVASLALYVSTSEWQCLPLALFGFLLAAGAIISLGRWLDVRTEINASSQGISFHSPLRRVTLPWDRLSRIRASQAGQTWWVTVFGEDHSHFRFRVREAEVDPERLQRIFTLPRGRLLVGMICGMAGLGEPDRVPEGWECKRADQPEAEGGG